MSPESHHMAPLAIWRSLLQRTAAFATLTSSPATRATISPSSSLYKAASESDISTSLSVSIRSGIFRCSIALIDMVMSETLS